LEVFFVITDDLAGLIEIAIFAARDAGEFTLENDSAFPIKLEKPANKQHGDFSTNIALTLKKSTGINDSRDIAARILRHLPTEGDAENGLLDRAEVAGPGFLNFYLKPNWLHAVLDAIKLQGESYGKQTSRLGQRILIEFVSANPTGPISVVNGRAAALGDVLGNLFAAQGAEVGREFYINDALNSLQLEKFAASVALRYLQELGHPLTLPASGPEGTDIIEPGSPTAAEVRSPVLPFPKDGYRGEYVRDIARAISVDIGDRFSYPSAMEPDGITYFRQATLHKMVDTQRASLEAFGLNYDTWFYESSLYETGAVDRAIRLFIERDMAYEKDGALWLRSSALGDDKDRVLVRSNEKATYVAADAAYHDNKFSRGYNHLINIWGADHHGYVARLKAGVAALGYDVSELEIILTQMVSLVRDGEAVIGGKRKGNVIELQHDLVDEVGKDAARFYFLLNSYETPATVDVELAKKQSMDNPVYYVQYAHARLCSILSKAASEGEPYLSAPQLNLLIHPAELDVLRKLADYPAEISAAADGYAPHRLTRYAMDMAGLMNVFYENCRVLSGKDETVPAYLSQARLVLVDGARVVMSNLLGLLGVSAPEKM
jgi:arginyl-tRNA synthetase